MKLSIITILFVTLAFALFKILLLSVSEETAPIEFPEFTAPDITFTDLSGGCGGFTDCIEYLAEVIRNIGAGIIFIVLFLVELLFYVVELFAVIATVTFTGIEDAPFWINALLTLPFLAGTAIILYKMLRKGSTDA